MKGAAENNLKNINVDFPLGVMTCVTGVSGSGKSSLVNEILYKQLARTLNKARCIPGKHKSIEGSEICLRPPQMPRPKVTLRDVFPLM